MTEPRADALARGLVAYLRRVLGAPQLDLMEAAAAISGGFDTEIYTVRLRGAPPSYAGPLVLRVLQPDHDPERAMRERATQNGVADLGYPAPRVLVAEADVTALGAPFLLMPRVPGRALLETNAVRMATVLADLQLRLHALDPATLSRALGPAVTLDGYLDALGRRIERGGLDGLAPLLGWLRARRPADGPLAICHGDFHPQNVLVDRGVVTGVLDWPNALVADPAFDVASTLNILRFVPVGLTSMSRAVRGVARLVQPWLARRYLVRYRRRRPIDRGRLAYYEAAAALRALVRAAESRRGLAGAPSGLDGSPYATRLLEHVRRVTAAVASL